MAGDGADTYDLEAAKADAAAMGIDLSLIEEEMNGTNDDDEEEVFELWAENAKHLRAYNLLIGSYIQSIGATCVILSCPTIHSITIAMAILAIQPADQESMALDLTAMCAEHCTITNKRLNK